MQGRKFIYTWYGKRFQIKSRYKKDFGNGVAIDVVDLNPLEDIYKFYPSIRSVPFRFLRKELKVVQPVRESIELVSSYPKQSIPNKQRKGS